VAVADIQAADIGNLSEPERRPPPAAPLSVADENFVTIHASPSIRRFARELGVDLSLVSGSSRKGRITREDVQQFVKQVMSGYQPAPATAATGAVGAKGIAAVPEVDFSQFGDTEIQALSRIQKISGAHLHRAWLNVPMVTHHDEADITAMEAFRQSLKKEAEQQGVRVTALVFIMQALAAALREFPRFNSSLAADGEHLILKKYCHIGVAVDTPHGLVVPVIREVGRKSIFELSAELAQVSNRARDGKLSPKDMQGGCMSISSLGGIGGSAFTPLVNAPEVAILGVTRARMKPLWNGKDFVPRLLLPLDVTYDHRVIDGAEAARFMVYLCQALGDLRRLLL
jgi:pyruvate dehydrogenase E2 component (dihydrolipoamide acetyltransferase)